MKKEITQSKEDTVFCWTQYWSQILHFCQKQSPRLYIVGPLL